MPWWLLSGIWTKLIHGCKWMIKGKPSMPHLTRMSLKILMISTLREQWTIWKQKVTQYIWQRSTQTSWKRWKAVSRVFLRTISTDTSNGQNHLEWMGDLQQNMNNYHQLIERKINKFNTKLYNVISENQKNEGD